MIRIVYEGYQAKPYSTAMTVSYIYAVGHTADEVREDFARQRAAKNHIVGDFHAVTVHNRKADWEAVFGSVEDDCHFVDHHPTHPELYKPSRPSRAFFSRLFGGGR